MIVENGQELTSHKAYFPLDEYNLLFNDEINDVFLF